MDEHLLNETITRMMNASSTTMSTENQESMENQDVTSGFLSKEFLEYSTKIVYVWINGILSFFGIIFNVINIAVFRKQGFSEVVNLSLFALAVSDLGMVLATFIQSICYCIWIYNWVEYINFRHVQYLSAAYIHAMFARIGSFLTAFISFERCLCVVLPLKVKVVLTKRVCKMVILSIYLPVMASFVIPYVALGLGPVHSTALNRTVVSLYYRNGQESKELDDVFTLIISLYQVIAFFLVVFFTSMLVFKMRQKNKWRQKTVTSDQMETMATKDSKVIKMVVVLCVTFIICFTPAVLQMIAMFSFNNYDARGPYSRMFVFIWSICTFGDIVCGSVNIFFYYKMSSRYSAIVNEMLPFILPNRTKNRESHTVSSELS